VALLLFVGLPIFICESHLRHPESKKQEAGTLLEDQTGRLIERLDKQKEQHAQWAYTALAAIVAIAVVKRTFKIPWIRPAYALLGTAGGFLLESLRAGQMYERYVTGFALQATLSREGFNTINRILWWQIEWLNYAAIALLLFVGMFLLAVLSGKVEFEQETHR
jgi:hypothetical protein